MEWKLMFMCNVNWCRHVSSSKLNYPDCQFAQSASENKTGAKFAWRDENVASVYRQQKHWSSLPNTVFGWVGRNNRPVHTSGSLNTLDPLQRATSAGI